MKWSFKLGRIAGIDVYVHASFALLLLWIGYVSYVQRHEVNDVFSGLLFIICLFGIIVLHELGHALTARKYGVKTRDITLLPIGGIARLERIPTNPKQELLVALAGPAVNFVLAGLLFGILVLAGWVVGSQERFIADLSTFGGNLLLQLFVANIFLAVFNLIPAFPMDGGRALRAILAMRLEYVRATQIAAEIGQLFAIVFGLFGLFSNPVNPFLLVIALFVWVGAAAEAGAVQLKVGLAGIPVSRVMIREFTTLSPKDKLSVAVQRTLGGFQEDFPVVLDEKVVGVLPRTQLLAGLTEDGLEGRVEDFMGSDFATSEPDEMVDVALERLKTQPFQFLPVIREGHLIGLLTMANVAELVTIQQAVREQKGAGPPRVYGANRLRTLAEN